jgi:hypothetical protein
MRKLLRRSTLTDGDADMSLIAAFEPYLSRAPAVGHRPEDMYTRHYVRRADEPALGYGLYAAHALEAGAVLGEYTGMHLVVALTLTGSIRSTMRFLICL